MRGRLFDGKIITQKTFSYLILSKDFHFSSAIRSHYCWQKYLFISRVIFSSGGGSVEMAQIKVKTNVYIVILFSLTGLFVTVLKLWLCSGRKITKAIGAHRKQCDQRLLLYEPAAAFTFALSEEGESFLELQYAHTSGEKSCSLTVPQP